MVGYLLVAHALHEGDDDFFFAFTEVLRIVGLEANHAVELGRDRIFFGFLFQLPDGRHEEVFFHLGVQPQPVFIVVDVVEHGGQPVVVQAVAGQVADDDALQLAQLFALLAVVFGVRVYVVFVGADTAQQAFDIRKDHLLLVFHVCGDGVGVFVI